MHRPTKQIDLSEIDIRVIHQCTSSSSTLDDGDAVDYDRIVTRAFATWRPVLRLAARKWNQGHIPKGLLIATFGLVSDTCEELGFAAMDPDTQYEMNVSHIQSPGIFIYPAIDGGHGPDGVHVAGDFFAENE